MLKGFAAVEALHFVALLRVTLCWLEGLPDTLSCTRCNITYSMFVAFSKSRRTCCQVAGLHGNVLQKILETQQLLLELSSTTTYSLAYMLARSSAYELHKAPSSANSNPELKRKLISTYGLLDSKRADGVYLCCQATGEILLSTALVAGHLFPRKSAVRLLHPPGLKLNDASVSCAHFRHLARNGD